MVLCLTISFSFPPPPRRAQDVEIHSILTPFGEVGTLKMSWTPCDEEGNILDEEEESIPTIESAEDLIGKPWCFLCEIKGCVNLSIKTDQAYCQYRFNGELFTTLTVEQDTNSPKFDYKQVHQVDCVDQKLVDWMENSMLVVQVFVNPYIEPGLRNTWEQLSTENDVIRKNFNAENMPKVESKEVKLLKKTLRKVLEQKKELEGQVEKLKAENAELKGKLGEGGDAGGDASGVATKLAEAKATDAELNG